MNAVKQYNKIMNDLCLEYLTIGTKFSEETDGWNIRDMVSECQYQLEKYYDESLAQGEARSCTNYMEIYNCSYEKAKEAHKSWVNDVSKLKRFINKYRIEAFGKTEMKQRHCSIFDI